MADNKMFIDEFMEVTNVYRKRHQVEPLKYNKEISKISQDWADKLVKTNNMSHNVNPKFKGETLGENIAFDSTQPYYSGHRAVGQWYQEIDHYDFKTHKGPTYLSDHFSQLVWKGSKEVGIGRAKTSDGKWIVVANYYPAGNVMTLYDSNVFPSIDGNTSVLSSPKEQIAK